MAILISVFLFLKHCIFFINPVQQAIMSYNYVKILVQKYKKRLFGLPMLKQYHAIITFIKNGAHFKRAVQPLGSQTILALSPTTISIKISHVLIIIPSGRV